MNIKNKRIGELLIHKGAITQNQLEQALTVQSQNDKRIGGIMVDLHHITEDTLANTLAEQFGYERYHPDKFPFDTSVADYIPADLAKRVEGVPLGKDHTNHVLLAIEDPMNLNAFDTIESKVGCMTKPLICTETEFHELFEAVYGEQHQYTAAVYSSTSEPEFNGQADELEQVEDLQINTVRSMTEERPVIQTVNWIISEAVRHQASDIHLSPCKNHLKLRFRIDGFLKKMPAPPKRMLLPIISRIKVLSKMDISRSMIAQDGRFTVNIEKREINIRVSTVPTINGENLVMRLLDSSSGAYTLEELGMDLQTRKIIQKLAIIPHGMILGTGPTGCGKSTTLYALLGLISSPTKNVLTIEDPVEYRMDDIRQVQLNEKAGMTFASSLRSLLRQDPDVLMVGEIRDSETAAIACRAALTGHLVLSTIHTNTSAGAISRLEDMGIAPYILATTVCACIAQRLVRVVCPHCQTPHEDAQNYIKAWNLPATSTIKQATGCRKCFQSGYRGRSGVYEVMTIEKEIKQMIFEGRNSSEIEEVAIKSGQMHTLKDDALDKLAQGITTPEEVMSVIVI